MGGGVREGRGGQRRSPSGALRFAAILLTVVLIGTACGGGGKQATGGGESPGGTATGQGSGTIVDGLYEEPDLLNPTIGANMTYSTLVELTMFSGLFTVDNRGQLIPDLATEIPTVENGGISKDGLTYTFHLRDAKWSDGVPFTAQDVDFTWRFIMNPKVAARTTAGFDHIASSKIVDDHTIQFHLKQPFAPFVSAWVAPVILPYHVFKGMSPDQYMTASYNKAPKVTLGPFQFKEWKSGDHITVVANPNYWRGAPKAAEIVFKIIPDQNSLLAAMQSGEINVYYFAPITQLAQLKAIPDAQVVVHPQLAYESAVLNLRNPILQDVRVRKALEYGLDREVLVKDVWKGLGTTVAGDQPPGSWAYDPSLKPLPYDPAQANKLLDEAGWKMGPDGYRYKNGQQLKLTYSTTAKNPWRAQTEQIAQAQWKKIGVNLQIRNYDATTYFGTILPKGQFDIGEYMYTNAFDPYFGTQVQYGTGAPSNFGKYSNPKVDQLLATQLATPDQAQRKGIYAQLEGVLAYEDPPALFYYSPMEIDVARGIAGYKPDPVLPDTWNSWEWAPKGR